MNLKELSRQLGLSQTTVSRALNGYPEVSEATRDRVRKLADKVGYAPSNRAKALATGKALAIGHVIPMSRNLEMVNPIFGDFLAGAGETYAAAGYEMVLTVLRPGQSESDVYRSLMSRRAVDGVVLHAPRHDDPRLPFLTELGLPFVVHGRASGAPCDYAWVDVDNRRAFARAARHLTGLGHRRIALVNGPAELDFARRRRDGYLDALAEVGAAPEDELIFSAEMTEDHGYRAASAILDRGTPPTAILCASLICALGVQRAIAERGLKMGGEVSVVTFDDDLSYLRNGQETPIFTAVRSSVRDAGRQAARLLLDLVADPSGGLPHRQLSADLIVGPSSGPAPQPLA